MKIRINETMLFQSKNNVEFKLLVASDFHYNKKFKLNIFKELEKIVVDERPNYLVIPGDLLSSSALNYHNLSEFLEFCSKHNKVIISLGDTDFENRKRNFTCNLDFFNNLEKKGNIKLFRENNNHSYRFDDVMFYGYSPNINHDNSSTKQSQLFKLGLINYLIGRSVDKKLYNVLLTHDARSIVKNKEEYQKYILNDIDLVISGNQGLIPLDRYNRLDETILLSSRGIKSINQLNIPEVDVIQVKKLIKRMEEQKNVRPSF